MAHAVPFLWQVHKLHHMDRELDVWTQSRHSWLEGPSRVIVVALLVSNLVQLDNADPWELGLIGGSSRLYLPILLSLGHMNVKLQVGWASLFYCSPQVQPDSPQPLTTTLE